MGGYLVILLHTEQTKGESCLLGWTISHLYSGERIRAGFQIAARTQVQTIEMHTVSQVQGAADLS